MLLRLFTIALLVVLLSGTTSSSDSVYLFKFHKQTTPSHELINAALQKLRNEDFHGAPDSTTLQYQHYSAWVTVTSPAAGELQLSFISLRGGCSRTSGVAGSRKLIVAIRTSLEQQFGAADLFEGHAANHQPEPSTPVERNAK
jgi:hypothetical protein